MAESAASTNNVDSTSDIADAVNHLIQGKRHLLVQDYVSAVASLQEACQLFAQKYGEAANECGEPYLYYGKALLELARMETGVLGNALEGVPAEEDESESEDDQVESPDNITEEEREKIKQDVDAAIDENSRDLEEKFQQLKEKSENETPTASADKDDSDKQKAKGISNNDDSKAKEAGTATSEKDKTENVNSIEKNEIIKEDVEKTCESVEITNDKKVDVADDAEKSKKDSEAQIGVKEDTGIKVDHEKNQSSRDENIVAEVHENEVATNDVRETAETVKVTSDIGMTEGLGKKLDEKCKSPPEETEVITKDVEETVAAVIKDVADPKIGQMASVTEKVESKEDAELKDDLLMDTDEPAEKSEASEKVDEGLKDSVKEESVIGATNEEETTEKSSFVDEEKKDQSIEQRERQIEEVALETSTDATEPSNAPQDESVEDDDAEAVEENDTSNADEAKGESEAGPSGSNGEKEEDVTNLQLAWEVLEIAKIIFKRQSETDKKMELKTAEVLLKLGEISIESENYKQAIEDLGECLRFQKLHLTPDDRAIAETYYQLGLANSFYGQFEEAIESFRKSMQVIEERIATLQQCTAAIADNKNDATVGLEDPVEAAKREIEDLQGVLPDIKSKIEDTEDLMRNSEISLKEAALQRLQETGSTACAEIITTKEQDCSKPTNNITHLLKRKRKSEGNVETNAEVETKKYRSASGDRCANGTPVANGQTSPMKVTESLQNVESTA